MEDDVIEINVFANDRLGPHGPFTVTIASPPSHAAEFEFDEDEFFFEYEVDEDANARRDGFSYRVCDSRGRCSTARVTLILPPPD